ncbi:hypothetical protein NKH77_22745 [Streptomyces sp. M19]
MGEISRRAAAAPRGAVEALAAATGTDVRHVVTAWELAERAWSRAELRHDVTMEAIRVAEARAALGSSGHRRGVLARARGAVRSARPVWRVRRLRRARLLALAPIAASAAATAPVGFRPFGHSGSPGHYDDSNVPNSPTTPRLSAARGAPGRPGRQGRRGRRRRGGGGRVGGGDAEPYNGRGHRISMFLGGVLGALLLVVTALLLLGPGGGAAGRSGPRPLPRPAGPLSATG